MSTGGHEGQVECRCCKQRFVDIDRVDVSRLREALASGKVQLPWGDKAIWSEHDTDPEQYEIFTCPICEYNWLEATYFRSEGIRVEHLTFGGLSEQACTMQIQVETNPITGEEVPVRELYLLGSEPVDYQTWHDSLMKQRHSYQIGVRMKSRYPDTTGGTQQDAVSPHDAAHMHNLRDRFWDYVRARRAVFRRGHGPDLG